jgi:hypothetical protein
MYSIRLIGGPEDGKLYAITDEQWDAGVVMFEIFSGASLPFFKDGVIPLPVIKKVVYRKKGRDNATFEFAGEVKPVKTP